MICPECHTQLQPGGGCWTCPNCGWGLCGKNKDSHQDTKDTKKNK